MKKTILIVTLAFFLIMGAAASFAAETPTFRKGNGEGIQNNFNSPEEALKFKLERIDALTAEGKITAEKSTEFKKAITERMNNCDGTKNRESKERLGIGFGRGQNKGNGQRLGNR